MDNSRSRINNPYVNANFRRSPANTMGTESYTLFLFFELDDGAQDKVLRSQHPSDLRAGARLKQALQGHALFVQKLFDLAAFDDVEASAPDMLEQSTGAADEATL